MHAFVLVLILSLITKSLQGQHTNYSTPLYKEFQKFLFAISALKRNFSHACIIKLLITLKKI